jgi:hypothetical protein
MTAFLALLAGVALGFALGYAWACCGGPGHDGWEEER